MADALTHVLIAYALATALSLRYECITPQLTVVAMVGGMLPDLSKLRLLVSAETLESTLGVPFVWWPFHTIGGSGIMILLASLAVRPAYRRPVALLLALGILSHFVLDMLLAPPPGTAPYLWPLIGADIALPGFYRSGDPWTAPVAAILALGVRSVVRRRRLETGSSMRVDR